MKLRDIGIVYRKEMKDSLRDRRTLISMIAVPILLMPLLTIGIGVLSADIVGHAMEEVPKIMIVGGLDSPGVVAGLRAQSDIQVVPAAPDYAQEIGDKRIRAAVEIPPGFEASLSAGTPATVTVYDYKNDLKSSIAADRLQKFFRDLRDRTVRQRLEAQRLPDSLIHPFDVDEQNVASPEKATGELVGGIVPYFVILLCLTGAIYPAIDLTAGEKERGTMETILSSPVSRTDLVFGKFLTVLTASLATAFLAVISMGVSFGIAKGALMSLTNSGQASGFALSISSESVAAVFAMVLPLAVLFSAALLAVALYAKSYKEAQSYLQPLTIIVVIPGVVSLLPGVELNARLALIPILNTSLVSKEILTGTYHWHYIALIFISSCVYAAIALVIAVKLFEREDVLFRT
ncbi:MAG: ABC transporter permease [Candidatus Acidiferrales bacterium]